MIIWIILTLIINVSGHFNIDLFLDASVLKALSIDLLDNYNADTNSLNIGNNDLTSEGEGDHYISNSIEEWRQMIPPMNEEEEWQPMFRVNDEEEEEEYLDEEEVMFRVNDEEDITAIAYHRELDIADEEWRHDYTTMAREVYDTGEFHIYEEVYSRFEDYEIAALEHLTEFIANDDISTESRRQRELETELEGHRDIMDNMSDIVGDYIRDLASGEIDSARGPVEDLDSLLRPAPVEETTYSESAPVEEITSSLVEPAPVVEETISSLLESAPVEETTSVQESIPVEYTTSSESIPVEDTTSVQESIPVEDTTSVQESVTLDDTAVPAPAPTEEPAAPNVDHPVSKKRNFEEYSDEDPDYELESSSGKGNKRNKTGS